MSKQNKTFPASRMYKTLLQQLADRDVTINDLAHEAFLQQVKYDIPYSEADFVKFTETVLHHPNVLNLAVTGFAIDDAANSGVLPDALEDVLKLDLPVYSVDETIALSIAGTYSTIGQTNYGSADVKKGPIASRLDHEEGRINVFADDIISGILGAIAGYVINKLAEERSE